MPHAKAPTKPPTMHLRVPNSQADQRACTAKRTGRGSVDLEKGKFDYKQEAFEQSAALLEELVSFGWFSSNRAIEGAFGENLHPNQIQIHYIKRGHVTWWAGEARCFHELRAGQLFIVRPGEPYGGLEGAMQACQNYWLRLELPGAGERLDGLSAQETTSIVDTLSRAEERVVTANQEIDYLFHMLLEEHQHPERPLAEACARSILHALLIQIVSNCQQSEESTPFLYSWRVRRTIEWLDDHLYDNEMHINSLCEDLNISPSGLRSRFKKETRQSPLEYLIKKRMKMACDYLVNTDESITSIAMTLGNASSQYFSTAFKRYFGITPSEYRKRNRQRSLRTSERRAPRSTRPGASNSSALEYLSV
ncbi:MAG: AraC family transcriptional regulator [Opitutales bacterium]